MITPSAGMEPAGACHAKKFARVFAVRRWKSNADWMARTGYASAAAICACAIAQHPCDRPQVLPAYGLQDLRNKHRDPKTKSNPNTMCLHITPGGNHGTDRKSTRLNSSHANISYAVFCLKKKKQKIMSVLT